MLKDATYNLLPTFYHPYYPVTRCIAKNKSALGCLRALNSENPTFGGSIQPVKSSRAHRAFANAILRIKRVNF